MPSSSSSASKTTIIFTMTIGYGHCKHGHIMVFLSSSHSVLICRHCSLFARWLAVIHFCKIPLLQFWLFKFCILMDVQFFSWDENSSLYFDILQKENAPIKIGMFNRYRSTFSLCSVIQCQKNTHKSTCDSCIQLIIIWRKLLSTILGSLWLIFSCCHCH